MFVIFSCVATNTLGRSRGHLALTGTPSLAAFDSPPLSKDKDSYNISWTVLSHAKVVEYELFFRQRYLHRSHHFHDNSSNGMNRNDRWNSVVVPAQTYSNLIRSSDAAPFPGVTGQKMSYYIRGLQPGTTYEARVQARNSHGWNKMSPVFHFTTKSNGKFILFST